MTKVKKQVIKSDINRVLLTETTPYELPVIVSNEGFYRRTLEFDKIETSFIKKVVNRLFIDRDSPKLPFSFEIVKNPTDTRLLSLLHPSSQFRFIEFYKDYSSLILEFCGRSPFSVRYPSKYASTYYLYDHNKALDKFKSNTVENINDTFYYEYASSYFAYSKFSFMHSYLKSKQFMLLETRYQFLRKLDISNCFGNIYSHSISWATKPRSLVKEVISNGVPTGGFDTEFDSIMLKSNLNETNGIPVGAEVSRIFAECILQKIDLELEVVLRKEELYVEIDYSIQRYMDDYFVFTNKKEISDKIEVSLSRVLRNYKLSLNPSKKEDMEKPFITSLTTAEHNIKEIFVAIEGNLSKIISNNSLYLKHDKLFKEILSKLRIEINSLSISYQDGSKYILKEILNYCGSFNDKYLTDEYQKDGDFSEKLISLFILLVELAFYFYSHDKRYQASTLLCQIVLGIKDNLERVTSYFKCSESTKRELSYKMRVAISDHLLNTINNFDLSSGTVEFSNFLCLYKAIKPTHQILDKYLDKLIKSNELNYFVVISLLYMFGNEPMYFRKKEQLCKKVVNNILGLNGERKPLYKTKTEESELLHLFCDFMSCYYVEDKYKYKALEEFLSPIHLYSESNKESLFQYFTNKNWFVNWGDLDFRNTLRKKRLKSTY